MVNVASSDGKSELQKAREFPLRAFAIFGGRALYPSPGALAQLFAGER